MAAVGITSPPAPSAFASAISPSYKSSNSSTRLHPLSTRIAAAATSADGGAEFLAAIAADSEAGTDVAGGATTSTRPPYSLISADNVQKAMRGFAITDADHYGRLGITKLASTDEVKDAYEKRCDELNSRGLEEELNKEHNLLKREDYTIGACQEVGSLKNMSGLFQVDPLELAPDPPKEPEDDYPTKLVGYVFLEVFILSVALSVTLNR